MADVELDGESLKIWNEIKNVQLDLFSLPDQTVAKYCNPLPIDPNSLYVTITATAVLPALDIALTNFNVEAVGKWIVISRKK
jgi:hypothetical protein